MVSFRRFLICLAAALATWGMSHRTSAHESGENEAAEHNGSNSESSENEGSEQSGLHNDGNEQNGSTSSGSGSSSSNNDSSSGSGSSIPSGNSSSASNNSSSTGSSSSGSANSNSDSANDNSRGTGSSRDDSRRGASTRSTSTGSSSTRSASTARVTGPRTSVASRTTRSRDGGTESKAVLKSLVGGCGSANYKVSRTNRSFEIELENMTLSPGQMLSVCVNDVSVGEMTVGLSRRRTTAKLKLETRLGQVVPIISAGSVITIKLSIATVALGTL